MRTGEEQQLKTALAELYNQLWGDPSAGSAIRPDEARALLDVINRLANLLLEIAHSHEEHAK